MAMWILLGAALCAAVWWCVHNLWDAELWRLSGQDTGQLQQELIRVVRDFLEAGELVRLLSRENYLGTISVRVQRRRGRLGYTVCMYDSGDIAQAFRDFQQDFPGETFPEMAHFVEAYGATYDAQRNALVYATRHSAKLSREARETLEQELLQLIALHPLAEAESLSSIHTKNLQNL